MTFRAPRGEDHRWADYGGVAAALAARPLGGAVDWRPFVVADGPVWVLIDGRVAEAPAAAGRAHSRSGAPLTDGLMAHGVALELGRRAATAGLVQIIHVVTGGAAHVSHRYALEEGAQASVLETYVSVGSGPAWANLSVEVELGTGARLMRAVRRLEGADVTATETSTVTVGEAASYAATLLLAGGGATRAEHHVRLAGEGAFASVDGAVLASEAAHLDVFNRLHHAVPRTTGRQTWRLLAADQAQASLIGRIEVARQAQKTDAEQSLKGLLLDRTATLNAKPELEIFADDVKAAHGCAVGALDPAALFYMAARGIAPPRARVLLTEAFVAAPLAIAGDETARAALTETATRWLEARP